jgi:MOSC domain-containing protein YiiM
MAIEVEAGLTAEELEAGLPEVLRSPKGAGTVELIACRPEEGERRLLEEGELDLETGLVGDMWHRRPSKRTADGGPNPLAQVTLMNARAADLVAGGDRTRWALAGDQLYVDLDISEAAVPAGTRLAVGTAVLEVTPEPHTGCAKFRARFGGAAVRFVNGGEHRRLRLRGANAKVVEPGVVRPGDAIRVLAD